jgi:hypothetical protein
MTNDRPATVDPYDTKPKTVPGTIDVTDKTKKPDAKPMLDPSNVFDDAYNLVPKPKDKVPDTVKPPSEFDPKFNNLNKVGDFPVAKEQPRPFTQDGEVGKLFVDEKSGLVTGMQLTDGSRKGQKYAFDRDDKGNITKMHMLIPGKDANPPQYLSLDKTEKGWVSKPAGQLPPGFKNLKVENGIISGDFKVNAKGDFGYESADKQTRSVLRINGDKDHFDNRDYSRERELKNGQKENTFWNGYDWLPGQKKQIAEGVVQVDFKAEPGKPTSMIRDAKNDGFRVAFEKEQTQYTIGNWNDGRMTRQQGATVETLYKTGAQDENGKVQWRKGQEKTEGNQRVVTFTDAQDAAKIKAGELPQASIINPKTGEVVSVYSNGTKVAVDERGKPLQITYKDQQKIDVMRDANNDFRGFKRSDGTVILKGQDLTAGPAAIGSEWVVQRPGQTPLKMNGILKHGRAGSFSILGPTNDGVTVDPEGIMSTKLGGTLVSDPPRPNDKMPVKPPVPADKTVPPAGKDLPKPPTKPGELPKPADKVPEKAPITAEQLKALSAKYKVDPRILNFAKDRSERQGMQKTFTPENLEKLLKLADKHKLLADFRGTADMSSRSTDGAMIGRLLPELLLDPTTAIDKANQQGKTTMAKSLQDGKVPQERIDSVLGTIDARYAKLRTNTQPFIAELTKELATKPVVPAPPVPLPK